GDGVENVGDAEFSDGQDQTIAGLRTAHLVDAGLDLISVAAEIDNLADKGARYPEIRIGVADFIGFAAGESRNAQRVAQSKALIDLRVDPELGAFPQPPPDISRHVPGLATGVRIQAVGAAEGDVKWRRELTDKRCLAMDRPIVRLDRGRHRLGP